MWLRKKRKLRSKHAGVPSKVHRGRCILLASLTELLNVSSSFLWPRRRRSWGGSTSVRGTRPLNLLGLVGGGGGAGRSCHWRCSSQDRGIDALDFKFFGRQGAELLFLVRGGIRQALSRVGTATPNFLCQRAEGRCAFHARRSVYALEVFFPTSRRSLNILWGRGRGIIGVADALNPGVWKTRGPATDAYEG